MPAEGPEWLERESILNFDEIERFVRIAAGEGVRKIRLTGGEPLVRRDLPLLVKRIAAIDGIRELTMTTNGTLLEKHALDLKQGGLTRLNVSLDSLKRERFTYISKFDMFDQVWCGIEKAVEVGFIPLKINMVVIRGFNDDEVVDFALLTKRYPFTVRFIEYMPIGGDSEDWRRDKVVPCSEILERISEKEQLTALEQTDSEAGPERAYKLENSTGRIGVISPVSDEFCARCNRIRLTSDGKVRGCLMRDGEVDFREAFRQGVSDEGIRELLYEVMRRKPEKHLINSPDFEHTKFYTMNKLGG
jgi:cyclic pyranopterin phosphate synthase